MKLIYFTKHYPSYSVAQLLDLGRRLGADGLDLAVRKGHAVNPENAPTALPQAVRQAADAGMVIPMLTAETSFNDPVHPATEPILGACAEAGVRFIKLGYYGWKPGDYWGNVAEIRRNLEAYERLGERFGVTLCYHTHSGGYYGSNCGTLMHLLQGFDPQWIGAYVDRGHMAANGELWPLGLDMVRGYLKLIAAKTVAWYREEDGDRVRWTQRWVTMREGIVDWPATFRALREIGYDGPVTLHGEYDGSPTEEQQIEMLADDFVIARTALEEASAGSL